MTNRYNKSSDKIDTGSYDLSDSNYAFLARQNVDGLFFPSQDEWIKAAYYAGEETGNGTNYFYFPTVSNEAPIPLFTKEGKNQDLAKGEAAGSHFARVNVSSTGEVRAIKLDPKIKRNQGYFNYDFGIFGSLGMRQRTKLMEMQMSLTLVAPIVHPLGWHMTWVEMLSSTPVPSPVLWISLIYRRISSSCPLDFVPMVESQMLRAINFGSVQLELETHMGKSSDLLMNMVELG